MNKKWITAVAVVAVGVSLTVLAAPQEAKPWHGHRGEWGQKFAQKLNLTDAQKQQLRDLHKQFRQDNKAFFESFRQTMKDYRTAKQAGDTAKLDSLKANVESQRTQMKTLREAQEPKILSILTPAQQAQYQALKAERAARHQ
jgi:protein CpxP